MNRWISGWGTWERWRDVRAFCDGPRGPACLGGADVAADEGQREKREDEVGELADGEHDGAVVDEAAKGERGVWDGIDAGDGGHAVLEDDRDAEGADEGG